MNTDKQEIAIKPLARVIELAAHKVVSRLRYPHTIIGNAALAFAGISVKPNDLDIVIDKRDFVLLFPGKMGFTSSENEKLHSLVVQTQECNIPIEISSYHCQQRDDGLTIPFTFGYKRNYHRVAGHVLSFADPSELVEMYKLLDCPKDHEKLSLIDAFELRKSLKAREVSRN